MTVPKTGFTAGKPEFYQGKQQTEPLLCIKPSIPSEHARGQASELMGCVLPGCAGQNANGRC